jgi:hypothetical protein
VSFSKSGHGMTIVSSSIRLVRYLDEASVRNVVWLWEEHVDNLEVSSLVYALLRGSIEWVHRLIWND